MALLVAAVNTSCILEKACEEDNVGTIVLENLDSEGTLELYINPIGAGLSGASDLSVKVGEQRSIDVPAGLPTIVVRRIVSTCTETRCQRFSTTLEDRTLEIASCETINLAY